jgi:glucokinase-like ROK family protein
MEITDMKKATREQSKSHNKTLILNSIYTSENISRADLARATHLTRSTVSEIVSELIEEELVKEAGRGQSAGGKPPVLLQVFNDARQIVGIDLASGEFRGALINLRGEIQKWICIPINEKSGEEALEGVYDLIEKLLGAATSPIIGIGIGAPGIMDSDNGIVRMAVNLNWKDLPLVDILQDKYQIPVYIANDSQVSALAEFKFGEGEKGANLLVVKIGRGVGSGIVINQQLFQGDSFGAGEIGHIKVDQDGVECRCGNFGCLETRISSRAVRKFAAEIAAQDENSLLKQFIEENQVITTETVHAAFLAGEHDVVEFIHDVGVCLGQALSYVVSVLNINRVVIAGSVSIFGEGIIDPALKELKGSVLSTIADEVEINASSLGEEIVILGAAGMVLQNELGIV